MTYSCQAWEFIKTKLYQCTTEVSIPMFIAGQFTIKTYGINPDAFFMSMKRTNESQQQITLSRSHIKTLLFGCSLLKSEKAERMQHKLKYIT